jgi:hypothetical protein
MARKIKIRWATSRYVVGRHDAIRVRISVVCAEGLTEKIFAYRMLPKSPQTGSKRGFFSHICSPADIEDFPEDEPVATHVPPWFRLSYVDVLVRSETEAEAFIDDVRSDIRRLLTSLAAIDAVFQVGEDDFLTGIQCFSSESSASSVSSSLSSGSSRSLGPLRSLKATGTFEQNLGYGQEWVPIGTGAGSPIGSSDSLDALNRNASRVSLLAGLVSKQLLIQGYDFDALPSDAVLEGILARLAARDATLLGSSQSSASAGSSVSSSSSASAEAILAPLLTYFRLYDPEIGFVGDEKSNNSPIFGPDWQVLPFGGAADLWNADISVDTLRRRGDFGVGLIVFLPDEVNLARVDVDGVELEVFYRD